jgi:hypothetical protein
MRSVIKTSLIVVFYTALIFSQDMDAQPLIDSLMHSNGSRFTNLPIVVLSENSSILKILRWGLVDTSRTLDVNTFKDNDSLKTLKAILFDDYKEYRTKRNVRISVWTNTPTIMCVNCSEINEITKKKIHESLIKPEY